MGYRRLAPKDRYQIQAYLQSGQSVREIAFRLGVAPSTVSRELKKTSVVYEPELAQEITNLRRLMRYRSRRKIKDEIEQEVVARLKLDWSPEQIAGRMKIENGFEISHQTIYRYVKREAPALRRHLRILRKQRKDRSNSLWRPHPEPIRERKFIEDRPKIVERRERIGDLERDTVLGKLGGSLLLTIVDRKSRYLHLAYLEKKSSKLVHQTTVELLANERVHTITNDNSTEFARHIETSSALNAEIYFSRAYRSWERGTNENTNGLSRQYFPRKCDIGIQTKQSIDFIAHRLNSRPRKCLGYRTPLEVHSLNSQVLR